MKSTLSKLRRPLLLATALAVSTSAFAAEDNAYSTNDVLLFLQNPAGSVGNDKVVYHSLGSAVNVFRDASPGRVTNLGNIYTTLNATMGSDWVNKASSIHAGAAGQNGATSNLATSVTNGDYARTVYVSKARASVGVVGQANSASPLFDPAQTAVSSQIAGSNNITGMTQPGSVEFSSTLIDGYNPFANGNPSTAYGAISGGIQNNISNSTVTFASVSNVVTALDLYRVTKTTGTNATNANTTLWHVSQNKTATSSNNSYPGSNGARADYLGTITLSSNGSVNFVAQGEGKPDVSAGNQTLTQNYNASYSLNSTVAFTSSVSYNPPGTTNTYAWRRNGVAITGATTANYTIPAVTANRTGEYSLLVTTKNGTTVLYARTSASWFVTAEGSPIFTNNPTASATRGTPYTFVPTLTANATAFTLTGILPTGLTFNGTTGNIVGTPSTTGVFLVKILPSNSFGSGVPINSTITVNDPPVPTISALTVNGNATATTVGAYNTTTGPVFTVVPNNAANNPLRYQWRRNGTAITAATNATYSIATASSNFTGTYDVIVTNAIGNSTTSRQVLHTLNPAATFTVNGSVNEQLTNGANRTFEVNVSALPSGGTASYQWFKGGVAIDGATSANYTVASFTSNASGGYSVQVTTQVGGNTVGSVTSDRWALTVQDTGVLVYTLTGPATRTIGAGQANGTITGYMVLDRANDKVAIIQTYTSGFNKYNSLDLREDFSVVTTGPVAGSRTAIVGSLNSGNSTVDHDLACMTGMDAEVIVAVAAGSASEIKVFAPNTITGMMFTLVRSPSLEIDVFNVSLAINKPLTTITYRSAMTFNQAVTAVRAAAVVAGFVNQP
jgi:hypothetical protein